MSFGLKNKQKRVQRGYASAGVGSIIISAVDMDNAELTVSGTSGWRNSGGSGGGVVGGRLINSTTVELSQGDIEGSGSLSLGDAYWEVSDYV
jgi:hypothetical protein